MLILPITRSWICSSLARKLYTACAVLALALIEMSVGTRAAQQVIGTKTLPPLTAGVLRIVPIPEVVGVALLWVAMWYFWFGFDRSHWFKRALWFLLLFFLAPYGPVFYCFFVYRQQTLPEE